MIYFALISKEPQSDYGVSFPDFPGCITAGTTLEDAKKAAIEALAGHISFMKEEGEEIPQPSSFEEIMKEALHYGSLIIEVNPELYDPIERVNITLPHSLLKEIAKQKKNRSAFLAEAAREKLRMTFSS